MTTASNRRQTLGRHQRRVVQFIRDNGGEAHITPLTVVSGTPLAGYNWDEVERLLDRLCERGILERLPFRGYRIATGD